jgi:periplasmic nitrate reductase NapD
LALSQPSIDRRALITGRILNPDRVVAPPEGEIASIIVQARPENLDEVAAAITSLAGCEVHGRDPKGKLIVVVDVPDTGSLGTTLNTISLLPHVHTASLVFHATEIA